MVMLIVLPALSTHSAITQTVSGVALARPGSRDTQPCALGYARSPKVTAELGMLLTHKGLSV